MPQRDRRSNELVFGNGCCERSGVGRWFLLCLVVVLRVLDLARENMAWSKHLTGVHCPPINVCKNPATPCLRTRRATRAMTTSLLPVGLVDGTGRRRVAVGGKADRGGRKCASERRHDDARQDTKTNIDRRVECVRRRGRVLKVGPGGVSVDDKRALVVEDGGEGERRWKERKRNLYVGNRM